MKPFEKRLNEEDRQAIRDAPKGITNKALAELYGVSRWGIAYYRTPGKQKRMEEQRKGRIQYEAFLRNSAEPRRKGPRKEPLLKLTRYEQMIHEAIGRGEGVDVIEARIDESLSQLMRDKFGIEEQIRECRAAQIALYAYLNVDAEILDDTGVEIREMATPEYMNAREMKILMSECGLSCPKLEKILEGRYSVRALQSYRMGQCPVPRIVAEVLKGYPKKQLLDNWG